MFLQTCGPTNIAEVSILNRTANVQLMQRDVDPESLALQEKSYISDHSLKADLAEPHKWQLKAKYLSSYNHIIIVYKQI